MNYEFNLLHHVGVVAKRVCAAVAAAHEGDNNTPSGPMGRGVKNNISMVSMPVIILVMNTLPIVVLEPKMTVECAIDLVNQYASIKYTYMYSPVSVNILKNCNESVHDIIFQR